MVTEEEIIKHGQMDEEGARANAGVWTWTIGDGSWSYEIDYLFGGKEWERIN